MSEPTDKDRYRVEREGLRWVVRCGNGTRILFQSLQRYRSEIIAAELRTAFLDGMFVGGYRYAEAVSE